MEEILEDKKYVKKALMDVWDNFPLLFVCDIFFCGCCLPSMILFISNLIIPAIWVGCFTIIPAISGLMYLSGRIANGNKFGMNDMLFGIRHFYVRSALLGSLIALPVSFLRGTLSLMRDYPDQSWFIAPLGLQIAGLLFFALLIAYIFSLMTIYDISLKKSLIYAFLLATRYKMPTIGMLSLMVLMALLLRWTKFSLLLVCPILWAIFASNITLLLIQKQQSC